MLEPDDHLAALLKQAADAAQDRTVAAPAAEILARGTRHRRRRFAVIAAAACLAVGAVTGVATTTLAPSDHGGRVEPATDPTPNPSPVPSESVTVEPAPGETATGQPPDFGQLHHRAACRTALPPRRPTGATPPRSNRARTDPASSPHTGRLRHRDFRPLRLTFPARYAWRPPRRRGMAHALFRPIRTGHSMTTPLPTPGTDIHPALRAVSPPRHQLRRPVRHDDCWTG